MHVFSSETFHFALSPKKAKGQWHEWKTLLIDKSNHLQRSTELRDDDNPAVDIVYEIIN